MDYSTIFGQDLATLPWVFLDLLKSHQYINDKKRILQRAVDEENWVFIDGFKRASDPLRRIDCAYAFQKKSDYSTGYTWKQFCEFDDDINNRKMSIRLRNQLVTHIMEQSDKTVWNKWFAPILNRNIRSGASYKLLNKVLSENGLDHLRIPLFYPQQMFELQNKKQCLTGDKFIDYKLNGERLVVVADPQNQVIAYEVSGRENKVYRNTLHEYANFANNFLKEPVVFDGEVMSEELYELKYKGYKHSDLRVSDAIHYVFDILPWKDYLNRSFDQPLHERKQILENTIKTAHHLGYLTNTRIVKTKRMYINTDTGENMDQLYDIYNKALGWGHDGVVIKNANKPYKCSRSHDWLKLKPYETIDLQIMKILGNETNNGLRRITCHGDDKDRYFIVNIGQGFKNQDKEWIWENRESLIDKHIEVSGIKVNPPSTKKPYYSLSRPSFVRMRPDLD